MLAKVPRALCVVLLLVAGCTSSPAPPDESDYLQKVLTWRAERDRNWSETTDPIPAERRAELLPLKYFPPDPSYVVPAELRLAQERPVVELPTSTGELRLEP